MKLPKDIVRRTLEGDERRESARFVPVEEMAARDAEVLEFVRAAGDNARMISDAPISEED